MAAPREETVGRRWLWWIGLGIAGVALGLTGCWLLADADITAVRGGMAVASMVLLVPAWLCDRRRWVRAGWVVTALLVAMVVCAAYVTEHKKTRELLVEDKIHGWNVFHYVLGTKYFDELGYFDLYLGALLADVEADNVFQWAELTRDMHTYDDLPRADALLMAQELGVKQRFTPQRWESFQRDLAQIQTHRRAKWWKDTLRDLGYNPSPAWLIVHRPLLNAVDVSHGPTLARLCSIDLLLYALTLLVMAWAFGLRSSLFATLWMISYFGNSNLLVGSYLHYDWLFFTILAVALYSKGWLASSAVVLAYVGLMRGFPGLIALFPCVAWLRELIRTRRLPPRYTRFVVALGLAMAVCVGLGSTTARGPQAWVEWKEKISIHRYNHPLFAKRVGLQRLMVHDFDTGRWFMSRTQREKVMLRNDPAYDILKWTLVGLALLAMIRRRDHDGLLLGIAVAFFLLVVSRYYASVWVLLLTWLPWDRRRILNLLSSLAVFGFIALFTVTGGFDGASGWKSYFYFNAWMLTYFVVVILGFLGEDVAWLIRRWRVPAAPGLRSG
jgi:hypothetical protein